MQTDEQIMQIFRDLREIYQTARQHNIPRSKLSKTRTHLRPGFMMFHKNADAAL